VTLNELVQSGGLNEATLTYLQGKVAARANIVVTGRPGSGRTTVANALAYLIGADERVAVVEKVRSISLPHEDVVHLDKDGVDASMQDLADLLPRLAADRVMVDEVSGAEVFDLVSLALGGQDGILAVTLGGDGIGLLNRMALELELVSGSRLADRARAMVAQTVHVVCVVERGEGGTCQVVEVLEVEGETTDGFATRQVLGRG
jgi:pilus assembly protein CpaF